MIEKNIVHYHSAQFLNIPLGEDPIGALALLMVVDHPEWGNREVSPEGIDALTRVVGYDETMGIIESANTVYVPA